MVDPSADSGLVRPVGCDWLSGSISRPYPAGRPRCPDGQTETSKYTPGFNAYLHSPSEQALARFNQTIHTLIEQDNVMVVEFYSADSRKVAEVVKPFATETEKRPPKHGPEFVRSETIDCEKLTLDHDIYLRVFIPIYSDAGAKNGYMEGVYHAPKEIIAQNRSQTLWSLLLVVVITFVTSLTLYPLIIRLNRKLIDYSHILRKARGSVHF